MRALFTVFVLLSLRDVALPATDSLFVRLKGDSTFIWDSYANENCGSKFVATVRVSNDTVYAVRVDTARLQTTCDCTFHFRFTVVGLLAGDYAALIYRQPFHQSVSLVGAITFTVPTQPSAGMTYALSQSKCDAALDGIDAQPQPVPRSVILSQNYPNPFNPSTTIRYALPRASHVTIAVYSTLGQVVSTLVNGEEEPGEHIVKFDGSNLSSGVYFYRLSAGGFVKTLKLQLIR